MTQLTCDKMNSHGSIKTFRVNKVYRAFKKRESFSSTLFIYSKYSPLHPPPSRNGFAVLFTNKKEPQKSQMRQRIKAKLKRLSDSCKITQEIWRRCCRVPKFCTVHISAEVLYIQVGNKMFRKNSIFCWKITIRCVFSQEYKSFAEILVRRDTSDPRWKFQSKPVRFKQQIAIVPV